MNPRTLESDPFVNFVMSCLAPDPKKGYIRHADLVHRVEPFFKESGLPNLTANLRKSVHVKIITILRKYFGL